MLTELRPPNISSNTSAVFGVQSNTSDFDHVNVRLYNLPNTATPINTATLRKVGDVIPDYSYNNLLPNKQYRIEFRGYDAVSSGSNGGNLLRWDWWVLPDGYATVTNLPTVLSNNPNINLQYKISSGVFQKLDWEILNLSNAVVSSGTMAIAESLSVTAVNLPDGCYLYKDYLYLSDTQILPIITPYPYRFCIDTTPL
jgi:hypothetical protein